MRTKPTCLTVTCQPLLPGLLLVSLAVASLAITSPATAQEPGASTRDVVNALARVPPGTMVRVQTRTGDVLQGPLRLVGDSILLGSDRGGQGVSAGERGRGGVVRVGLADVRSAWQQQRRTRTGALAGGAIGFGAGGAFMGLLALVAGADSHETVTLLAFGTLGGAAAGGLLGGVVGAAVPHWVLVYPADDTDRAMDVAAAPDPTIDTDAGVGRRRVGAFEASLGYGRIGGDEPTSGGAGGRMALHAELGADPARTSGTTTFFVVGPEVGWFDLGSTHRLRRRSPVSGDTLEFTRAIRALTAGGVVRGGLATGVVRSYAMLGLAFNRWEIEQRDERWIGPIPDPQDFVTGESRFEHLGYTFGAGAQASLRPNTAVGLELRRTSVGTFDMDLPGSYWTVTVVASRRW